MKKCLIFLEREYEKFCIDLLKTANEMYGNKFKSYALSLDADIGLIEGYFDEIIQVEHKLLRSYDITSIVNVIEEIYADCQFDSILILATHFGRMLAPALAMHLKVGLVADVTKIGHYKDEIEMIRPAFSGKLFAGIINTYGKTLMMSVRPGAFLYEDRKKVDTKIWIYNPENVYTSNIKRISRKKKPETKDIRESEVIISGGGGILENFDMIDGLAWRLNGVKAASRRVVDSGKADRSIQVGQSGKIVHPKLYIALGIYGALQHVAGLNCVEDIIAVNTNVDAPMCSLADIVVEGDAKKFIVDLIERIDREK